jgi:hypothetical protein
MTYRRRLLDQGIERDWRDWLQDRSEALAELGLPLDLYSSRTAWEDFLSTGSAAFGLRDNPVEFDFNDLSVDEQKRLHQFLEREFGADKAPGLLGFLRVRAAHAWIPPYR